MSKHTTDHMSAIKAGEVTKRNVIGLKKAINADARRQQRLSVSCTAPTYTHAEVSAMLAQLKKREPRVTGELHETGLKLLRSKRYRKRLASVQSIIDNLECFKLVGFDSIGHWDLNSVPVFRACGGGKSFVFRNIAWQSGGNGPEIL